LKKENPAGQAGEERQITKQGKTDYETDEINETDEKYSGVDRARTSD
jgi:hypothetical protein